MNIRNHDNRFAPLIALLAIAMAAMGLVACETDEVEDRYSTEPYGVEPGERPVEGGEPGAYRIDEPNWMGDENEATDGDLELDEEGELVEDPLDTAYIDEPEMMEDELGDELLLEDENVLPPSDDLPPMTP